MSAINISTQTAEVKTITHHKDLSESLHEALWYTTEEWGEMESRNMREIYELQMAAEYGYAELTEHGWYEYIDSPSSEDGSNKDSEDDVDSEEEDEDDEGSSEDNLDGRISEGGDSDGADVVDDFSARTIRH